MLNTIIAGLVPSGRHEDSISLSQGGREALMTSHIYQQLSLSPIQNPKKRKKKKRRDKEFRKLRSSPHHPRSYSLTTPVMAADSDSTVEWRRIPCGLPPEYDGLSAIFVTFSSGVVREAGANDNSDREEVFIYELAKVTQAAI
jgi:hypothetical protein